MRRPSKSRQVPKFSTCKSPTARTCGAKKGEGRSGHVPVLQLHVGLHHADVATRPFFKVGGRTDNVRQLMFIVVHESSPCNSGLPGLRVFIAAAQPRQRDENPHP